jgi:hypothetical protein
MLCDSAAFYSKRKQNALKYLSLLEHTDASPPLPSSAASTPAPPSTQKKKKKCTTHTYVTRRAKDSTRHEEFPKVRAPTEQEAAKGRRC